MKKTILLISAILLLTVLFSFCVSASPLVDIPDTSTPARFDIITHPTDSQGNNPFVEMGLGLNPIIFNATCFYAYDVGYYNALIIGLNLNSSSTLELGRSLSIWFELSPDSNFSDFLGISLQNPDIENSLEAFPYNNVQELSSIFDTLGFNYHNARTLGNQVDLLNIEISALNDSIQNYESRIESLELTISQKNTVIERLELDVSQAYSQGLEDSEIVQNSFVSIATMPFYFLKSIFNFEVFGINFFTIVQVILTLLFISVVIKIFI